MPVDIRADRRRRFRLAAGGPGGSKPLRPGVASRWRPGDPLHWHEVSAFQSVKTLAIRLSILLYMAASFVYLQYRARFTIGVFDRSKHPAVLAYQILFFVLEALTVIAALFRLLENWRIAHRNCVDFNRVPSRLIAPYFKHPKSVKVRPQFCNYPSIDVLIPCYNEDVDLVLDTVLAALAIDYPNELLKIYLCDDGQDPAKREMIAHLRKQYRNLHYVTRDEHKHAKAGNLNHALQRTASHLIVTLDADFIARPNIIMRLLPYYFVWNPSIAMYEFNSNLAAVQTPQHYRNLSPYDADPFDQRASTFFDMVMPGKDFFNATPIIGTTNLMNRVALTEVGFYPYHSITEDTALSMNLHSTGYRTYYVNESLATGLATATLWGLLRQRARWLKGDFQILWSRNSPFLKRGLSFAQRSIYIHMTFSRFLSFIFMFFDFGAILVLIFGIAPIDVEKPEEILIYLGLYIFFSTLQVGVVNSGSSGLSKAQTGTVAFEAVFRYSTVKAIFMTMFGGGRDLQFKVTDKPKAATRRRRSEKDIEAGDTESEDGSNANSETPDEGGLVDGNQPRSETGGSTRSGRSVHRVDSVRNSRPRVTPSSDIVLADGVTEHTSSTERRRPSYPDMIMAANQVTAPPMAVTLPRQNSHRSNTPDGIDLHGTESTSHEEDDDDDDDDTSSNATGSSKFRRGRSTKWRKQRIRRTAEEIALLRQDRKKNLKRIWFNILMAALLIFAIVWGALHPHSREVSKVVVVDGVRGRMVQSDILPMALAFGFALANLLPHLLAIYLCLVPFLSGWMMTDLVHGRCDQWAVHPKTGKLFVPWSPISLLSVMKSILIFGALGVVGVTLIDKTPPKFVPF